MMLTLLCSLCPQLTATTVTERPQRVPKGRRFLASRHAAPWATVLLCLLAPAWCRAGDAEALLQRHARWLGGRSAFERLRDLTWSGMLATAGLTGTLVLRETRPGWHHREAKLGPTRIVEVTGPEGAWALNWNQQVDPMSPSEAEAVAARIFRRFGRHLSGDSEGALQDLGSETRDGRSWRVLRFRFPNNVYFDLFLDPGDASCGWVREGVGDSVFLMRLSDWRTVSGVRMPFDEETLHDDPKLGGHARWHTVKANQGLSAADFLKPTPRATLGRIAGKRASTPWLEMELVQGRFVYLKGRVNGRETPIFLDSGGSTTILSATFADALGLSAVGSLYMQGATSAQEAALVSGIEIEMGPLRLSGLTAAVADLAGPEKAMGRAMPVILGKEVFNAFVVDIDYPHSRIAFHMPAAYRPDDGARPLRLVPDELGLRLIEASVEGLPPAPLIVDIGSAGNLTLFQAYTEKNGLLVNRFPRSQRLSRGAGGGSVVALATLKSFTLAGLDLRDMPADFYQGRGGAFDTRDAAGNLGAGVLSRFRVVFDYSRDFMYLTPGYRWDRPFCKNRAGFQTDFHGSFLEVVFVAPGSPAAEAGWRVGERITAIDHKPITADYLTSRVDWSCGRVGSAVILTDSDGVDRSVALADYY